MRKIDDNKIPKQPVYKELKKTSCATDSHKKFSKNMLKHNLNQYGDRLVSIRETQTYAPVQQSMKGHLSQNKVVLGGRDRTINNRLYKW